MEEKERYEYFFGTNTIKDNKTNQFYGCVVDLLNQQDKRIKELEEELKNYKLCRCVDCSSEYEYGLETSIDELEKENQQLKQQLSESETQLKEEIEEKNGVRRALTACNCQNDEFADMIKKLVNENEELKQQLHDLSKKIVEEIRENMSKRIMEKQIKWGDNIQIGFICNAINECLDTILEKFGEKDE